jgi:putative transposase
MIDPEYNLPISKQCSLLDISRGYFYYKPVELSEFELDLLKKLDALYTEDPTFGTRRMRNALRKRYKLKVGRDRIRKLMDILGVAAIYPKKNLSMPNKEHKKYPYLLRGVEIKHPNHVWSIDITYIRLKRGFVYLVAIIDWHSRYVLSWKLSTTLDRRFCVEALNEAIAKHGIPEIFNSDQGVQFTSGEFTQILKDNEIKISMDGKGRALDNIFVERLWRTVKYENVYLKEYRTVRDCQEGLAAFFDRYNTRREHQSLDYNYPAEIYFGEIILKEAA